MTWSYDNTDLTTDTSTGRLNSVRFLIGDTNTSDQQVQDEEITFALSQSNDNIYKAGSYICRTLANKYAREVDIDLDGQLAVDGMSNLSEKYNLMAISLEAQYKGSTATLGVFGGGLTKSDVTASLLSPTSVQPVFRRGQFDNPPYSYLNAETDE